MTGVLRVWMVYHTVPYIRVGEAERVLRFLRLFSRDLAEAWNSVCHLFLEVS